MFTLRITLFIILFLPVFLLSCGENETVDCEDFDASTCIGIEPESTDVEILFTLQNDSDRIPFVLYQGKYEMDGNQPQEILRDTATLAVYYVRLPFFHDYSVRAEYRRPSGTVFAVDGAYLKKKDKKVCDTLCWYIYGDLIDVRLKHFD